VYAASWLNPAPTGHHEHYVAWDAYRLPGQLDLVANGATPVATPLNFRA
jgi:hypothetical protein